MQYSTIDTGRPKEAKYTRLQQEQFFYVHAPSAWEVVDGEILPRLTRDSIAWGLHNVKARTDNSGAMVSLDVSRYMAEKHDKGVTVIPHAVDAPDHPSYMTQASPDCFVDRWTLTQGGTENIRYDFGGYNEWRKSLLERGIVPEPSSHDLDAIRRKLERQARLLRMQADQVRSDAARSELLGRVAEIELNAKVLAEAVDAAADREGDSSFSPGVAAAPELEGADLTPSAPKSWKKGKS